jgi:hypothetical protein
MKADVTRNTYNPLNHFLRVLQQQGRVQIDADWNEQAAILLDYLQSLASDLIGPHGGPGPNPGFQITSNAFAPLDFNIGPGDYYVDGILCEAGFDAVNVTVNTNGQVQLPNPGEPNIPVNGYVFLSYEGKSLVAQVTTVGSNGLLTLDSKSTTTVTTVAGKSGIQLQRAITYLTQPDYPNPPVLTTGNYQVYLDVWERLITYVEDDRIREVALGGADTAARSKLVWQVKVGAPCQTGETSLGCCTVDTLTAKFQPPNRGLLKAAAKQKGVSTDPCVIAPNAAYRGPENQLYRVEIHTGSFDNTGKATTATFKWSRENGSVVFPIVNISTGSGTTTVALETLGRDDRFGLNEGDWVEIQDDTYVLQNLAQPLMQVQSISPSTLTVTLTGTPATNQGQGKHPLLRRWDQTTGDQATGGLQLGTDGTAAIDEGSGDAGWVSLEDGVQIQFQSPVKGAVANQYRTGDYWLIPARTATGNVEWPQETTTNADGTKVTGPHAEPPLGVNHCYAPLGVIEVGGQGPLIVPNDCRMQFPILAKAVGT